MLICGTMRILRFICHVLNTRGEGFVPFVISAQRGTTTLNIIARKLVVDIYVSENSIPIDEDTPMIIG